MSAITLFKGANLPSRLQGKELDETTKALMSAGGGSFKRISIKGGVFRMISNGEQIATNEDRSMNVVVVAAAPHNSRTYYEGTYQEGANASPACWSADGITPSEEAEAPQASKCANCPQNVAGSGQGQSKACRFSRRLAVVLEGDLDGDVYGLTLPATSIFGKGEDGKLPLQAYVNFLATHNCPVTAVVTEMRFDVNSATPKLTFKAVRPLNDEEDESAVRQGATPEAKAAITMSVPKKKEADSEEGFEKPLETKAKAEVEDEPVKRTKKAEAPEKQEDLAKILENWGDD